MIRRFVPHTSQILRVKREIEQQEMLVGANTAHELQLQADEIGLLLAGIGGSVTRIGFATGNIELNPSGITRLFSQSRHCSS